MKEKETRAVIKELDECLESFEAHAGLLALSTDIKFVKCILRDFAGCVNRAKSILEAALAEKGGAK